MSECYLVKGGVNDIIPVHYCIISVHTTEEWLTSLKKIAHWLKIYL